MSAELKPCPFCGGSAEFVPYKSDGLTLKCTSLGCIQRNQRSLRYGLESLRDSMTKHWNTRAPQWLPIESAPRDGAFYLATDGKHQRVENCPDGHVAGIWHRIDGDWRGSALGDDSTHWQPLPAPPEVKA